jgi:hypothetical protein
MVVLKQSVLETKARRREKAGEECGRGRRSPMLIDGRVEGGGLALSTVGLRVTLSDKDAVVALEMGVEGEARSSETAASFRLVSFLSATCISLWRTV